MDSPLELVARSLWKTYASGVVALADVDLELEPGMFGLLGPNGAGKTTLMRTLATLQDPDRGSIRLGGIDIVRDKDAMRRNLGYLPQDIGTFGRDRCTEVLDELARLKGLTGKGLRQEVARVLELTSLTPYCGRRLASFSGGMLRRFGVAQALIGSPRVLIVDEPTAGLDPEERHRFHHLLARVGERSIVLISTHLVEDVEHLCDRVAVLMDGQIVAEGSPQTLVQCLAGRVWQTDAALDAAEELPAGSRLLSSRPRRGGLRLRVAADSPQAGYAAVEPSLEDYYFWLRRTADRSKELTGSAR